jgi:hypothetical protein
MFMILIAMLLLFVWLKRKGSPQQKRRLSSEAMEELEMVLKDYRQVTSHHQAPVNDVNLLLHPKETIKQYLQITIGLATLNKESLDGILHDYYHLARFQPIDKGDEEIVALLAGRSEGAQDDRLNVCSGDGQTSEETRRVEEKYRRRIADETSLLESELKSFLKRKRLF